MRVRFTKAMIAALAFSSLCCVSCGESVTAPALTIKGSPETSVQTVTETTTTTAAPETTATTVTTTTAATTTTTTTDSSSAEPEAELSATVLPDYMIGKDGEPRLYDIKPVVEAYRSGDRSALNETDSAILDKASEILDTLIYDGMTEYEKELAVHDYLINECTYDKASLAAIKKTTPHSDDPYGALINGSAICKGYTTTFQLLMEMLDIPCETVYFSHPEFSEHDHAWNIVTIDGAKYYVDLTWDDPVPDSSDRLTRHLYFNISRDTLATDHSDTDSLPETPDLKDAYASHELSPEPNTEEELSLLVRAEIEKDNNAIYFIPTDEGIWKENLKKKRDGTYIMTNLTFESSINGCFTSNGCRLYKIASCDTDRGTALTLLFIGNKPKDSTKGADKPA